MKKLILTYLFSAFLIAGYAAQPEDSFWFQGIPETGEAELFELKVYPNPTFTRQVTLEMNSGEISEIRLINIAGKEIITRKMDFGTSKYQMALENVPNGIYFIRVNTTEKKTFVKKLIVSSR